MLLFALIALLVFPTASASTQTAAARGTVIWGTDSGLYRRDGTGKAETLWSGGKVQKIIKLPESGWVIMADTGVFASDNLSDWASRSGGLPERLIKLYEDGKKSFIRTVQEIKDLEINPADPRIMACAFKDAVYLSRNGGLSWENLGMPSYRSTGIKAVATFIDPEGELSVLCSHSIYGVYRISPGKPGAKWIEISDGFEKLETTDNPDEISDFMVTVTPAGGKTGAEIYASQSFRRRIYKYDPGNNNWNLLWSGGPGTGAVDSLAAGKNSVIFLRDGEIMELSIPPGNNRPARARTDLAELIRSLPGEKPNCLYSDSIAAGPVSLSELWLLDRNSRDQGPAAGKEGLYLPVNHAMESARLKPYLDILENRNLNMVVIDMKDDYGRLRFTPKNQSITNIGRVFWPIDIEAFSKTMKERGIYTVARIVVFKDPEAARKNGAKYAVWDGQGNKAWEGYYDTRRKKTPATEDSPNPALVTAILPADNPEYEILRTWYDEKWVDPYSEEIWDYNASIAEELCERGFDEIQFDYIRFPTDGANLADARYRWKDDRMDMDSAILSFLRHVRSRVSAPISVDIYGANGWYRTGARTGQEVELLSPWVDVICPMYYPSHFEQDFLAHDPPELRPYRIYNQGTLRTGIIARGKIIVRPWAQAFYLNVSYDRKYYNDDYVRLEAEGSRAAGNGGFTYWNNSGRYDDIPSPADITVHRQ